MENTKKPTLEMTVILLLILSLGPLAMAADVTWTHKSSTTGDLPAPNDGKQQTCCLILDIDRDGIDDFVIGERTRTPSVVWYKYNGKGWDKFVIDNTRLNPEAGGDFFNIEVRIPAATISGGGKIPIRTSKSPGQDASLKTPGLASITTRPLETSMEMVTPNSSPGTRARKACSFMKFQQTQRPLSPGLQLQFTPGHPDANGKASPPSPSISTSTASSTSSVEADGLSTLPAPITRKMLSTAI